MNPSRMSGNTRRFPTTSASEGKARTAGDTTLLQVRKGGPATQDKGGEEVWKGRWGGAP